MDVSLMYLIHYHHIVPREVRIRGELTEKKTLRQEEDLSDWSSTFLKPNLHILYCKIEVGNV